MSSDFFSYPLFFSSSSGTPIIQMLVHLILPQRSLRLSSVLFILFTLFCYSKVISTIFSSLVFLDYINPFNICCKAGLVVLNSLNVCFLKSFFISPSILNEILAVYCNLGCTFFLFSTLNIFCHSLLACRDQLLSIWGFPCMLLVSFSLLLFMLFLCV